jgi:hypothetical protein
VTTEAETAQRPTAAPQRPKVTSLEILCVVLVVALVFASQLGAVLDVPAVRTGGTIFVAICVQALPFLVVGVLISGAIAAFVPASVLRKALPRNGSLAVGAAGLAGVALPGCECASVPVARRLMARGVPPAAALAFLLSAPAINPVVVVATAVAFPGHPEMVVARFVGSLATSVVMGLLWARFGRADWLVRRALDIVDRPHGSRWSAFAETARADLVAAGGFLVFGALISAVLNVAVPESWLSGLAGHLVLSVIVMASLAVVLALCSEADAFVAASLSALPLLPRLVFLVVGPAVDVKLIALQAGTFGRRFAIRFAPATFVVAIGCAVLAWCVVS